MSHGGLTLVSANPSLMGAEEAANPTQEELEWLHGAMARPSGRGEALAAACTGRRSVGFVLLDGSGSPFDNVVKSEVVGNPQDGKWADSKVQDLHSDLESNGSERVGSWLHRRPGAGPPGTAL
jgi:hypothetical protein